MDQTALRHLAVDATRKLDRYAYARDRETEHEPRTLTLTDDEALALLWLLAGRPADFTRTGI